jgi:hypothetical protein
MLLKSVYKIILAGIKDAPARNVHRRRQGAFHGRSGSQQHLSKGLLDTPPPQVGAGQLMFVVMASQGTSCRSMPFVSASEGCDYAYL